MASGKRDDPNAMKRLWHFTLTAMTGNMRDEDMFTQIRPSGRIATIVFSLFFCKRADHTWLQSGCWHRQRLLLCVTQ